MIMTGEFRDSQGRKIIIWEDKQEIKTPAYAPAPAVQAAQPNNIQNPRGAAGPAPRQETPPAAQAPKSSSPTTVVIQDPNAKISIFSRFLSFVGYVLMTLSLLFLIGCALNLIAIAVACLPDDVANEVEQFWGSPNWVSALRGLLMFVSVIVLTGSATVILILRRRFGGAHIVRFIIAIGLLALALAVVSDCSGTAPAVDKSVIGQPAGVFLDEIMSNINEVMFLRLCSFSFRQLSCWHGRLKN